MLVRFFFAYMLLSGLILPSQAQQPASDTSGFFSIKAALTAEFKGGETAWLRFLSKNLHAPANWADTDFQGRVVVKFTVGPTGRVSDIELLKNIDPEMDREIKRVIALSDGMWMPAMACGRYVRSYKTVSVNICLSEQ